MLDGLASREIRHEPGLSRVAREVARTAPDSGTVPAALLDGIVAWAGMYDPSPQLAVAELPAAGAPCGAEISPSCRDALTSVLNATRSGLVGQGARLVGAGTATLPDGAVRIIIAVTDRAVQLDPVARQVANGGKVRLHGRLLGKRSKPSVEVVDAQGRWLTLPARVQGTSFTADVVCDRGRGMYQVEVLAEGIYGPEVAANFPIYCGTAAPTALRVEVERVRPEVSAEDVARSNFVALNNARTRQGLPALQWDNAAAVVAVGHSQDMLTHKFVGHDSPRSGGVGDRFRKAKIEMVVLRENVARGYGPRGIHDSLMMSPGHRVNILAEDVTHVGIGAVIGAAETNAPGAPRPIFLTQNFYAKVGADMPADPIATLRGRIDELRRRAGIKPLVWDDVLFGPSQTLAAGVAAGRAAAATAEFHKTLDGLPFRAVQHHQIVAGNFAALSDLELWKQPIAGSVGLGISQVEKGKDAGSVVVIVTVAKR